jgi:hypothetical protein
MNNENLINEVKAKKRQTKKNNTSQNNTFEGGDTVLNNQLLEARIAVKNQTKAFIVGGGISDALYEIANGDFGDAACMALDMLNNTFTLPMGIETELIEEELTPKQFLLTSEKSDF